MCRKLRYTTQRSAGPDAKVVIWSRKVDGDVDIWWTLMQKHDKHLQIVLWRRTEGCRIVIGILFRTAVVYWSLTIGVGISETWLSGCVDGWRFGVQKTIDWLWRFKRELIEADSDITRMFLFEVQVFMLIEWAGDEKSDSDCGKNTLYLILLSCAVCCILWPWYAYYITSLLDVEKFSVQLLVHWAGNCLSVILLGPTTPALNRLPRPQAPGPV